MLRITQRSGLLIFILLATWLLVSLTSSGSSYSILSQYSTPPAPRPEEIIKSQGELWARLKALLIANPPGCDPPERIDKAPVVGYDTVLKSRNTSGNITRPDLINISSTDVMTMQDAHRNFVGALETAKWPLGFTKGTLGIVTTAGGKYLPTLVVSIRMLRYTGCKLPVEVFMLGDEYEKQLCEDVLPGLDTTCIVLTDILDINITHYQLKIFSILFSGFEKLLFLDSDAFPIKNPKPYFNMEPFKSFGMVTWPDFWMNTASKKYFTISSQKEPSITERAASETGAIMINKSTHQKTLLLSAYYNYYGPTHYYPLQSQGGPGEGDKETFITAAAALNESFYTVREPVNAIGRMTPHGLEGSAMIQHDPHQDYAITRKGIYRILDPAAAPRPDVLFIHAHYPKLNPETIFSDKNEINPTEFNGKPSKGWLFPEDIVATLGKDLEKQVWKEMRWVACECEKCFVDWQGKSGICRRVNQYVRDVFPENVLPNY